MSVTVVVLLADTVVSHRHVDAFGVCVTSGGSGVTFVDRADERVVIPSQPLFPFSLISWRTLSKNVVEEVIDTIEEILCASYVVEVDQLAWYCTSLGCAFCAVSIVVVNMRRCNAIFLLVNFAKRKHFVHENVELLESIAALAKGGSTGDQIVVERGGTDL